MIDCNGCLTVNRSTAFTGSLQILVHVLRGLHAAWLQTRSETLSNLDLTTSWSASSVWNYLMTLGIWISWVSRDLTFEDASEIQFREEPQSGGSTCLAAISMGHVMSSRYSRRRTMWIGEVPWAHFFPKKLMHHLKLQI